MVTSRPTIDCARCYGSGTVAGHHGGDIYYTSPPPDETCPECHGFGKFDAEAYGIWCELMKADKDRNREKHERRREFETEGQRREVERQRYLKLRQGIWYRAGKFVDELWEMFPILVILVVGILFILSLGELWTSAALTLISIFAIWGLAAWHRRSMRRINAEFEQAHPKPEPPAPPLSDWDYWCMA